MNITLTKAVEWITFVFHSIQNMTSTRTDGRARDTCMVLSLKSTLSTHLRKNSMIMRHRVLFATSSHVVQCLWGPHGMTVHLGGPRSIMGTWWLDTTTTRRDMTSSVLTRMQSLSPVPVPTRMVPYCTPCRDSVAHFPANHTSLGESLLAPCVPSDEKTATTGDPEKQTNNDFIDTLDLK